MMFSQLTNRRSAKLFLVPLLSMLAPACAAAVEANESAIRVAGGNAEEKNWTIDRLEKEFTGEIKPVEYTSKGQKHVSRCVPMLSLIKNSGAQTDLKMDPSVDPKSKNLPLRLVAIVRGRDGYTTAFSIAELLPTIGHREVWLAIDVDGRPLPESDGPAKLIVPSDDKPARWVRAVSSITILDVATASKSK